MPFAGAKAFPSRYGDAERPTTRLDTMAHVTDEEREIIRTHFPTMERRQLQALLPKRSWNGIRSVARRMKLRRKTKPDLKWKPDEVRVLQEMDPASACSMEIAAVLPGPNRTSITDHSQELGLAAAEAGEPDIRITSRSPPTGWSIGEFLVLLESYPSPNLMMEDIARQLPGKSLSQIRRAAHGANLRRPRSAQATAVSGRDAKNVWTDDEDALVLSMWRSASLKEIQCLLPHRTEGAIANRGRKLLRQGNPQDATAPYGNLAFAAE